MWSGGWRKGRSHLQCQSHGEVELAPFSNDTVSNPSYAHQNKHNRRKWVEEGLVRKGRGLSGLGAGQEGVLKGDNEQNEFSHVWTPYNETRY